jgi:PAS domain S-box-containing protein
VNGRKAKVAELTGLKAEDAMRRSLSEDLIIQNFQNRQVFAERNKSWKTADFYNLALQVNGWNAKVAELTGLKVEDAMGRSLSKELIIPEFQETVERILYLALNGEEEQNVEIRLKTWPEESEMDQTSRRGESVILVVNACSSRDVNENVVGVCFVGQDITSHKMVQDKYTRMMGDYQAIVHNPHALIPPIFGTDEFGTTTEWNPAMQKLTGYQRDDVVGKMLVGEVFGLSMMLCRLQVGCVYFSVLEYVQDFEPADLLASTLSCFAVAANQTSVNSAGCCAAPLGLQFI